MNERWLARLGAFWSVSYSPLRPYWLLRGLYSLLALDLWFEMIEHGGRYGLGDFNVAHFSWLDAFPIPSATFYLALLIGGGALSLLLAFDARSRPLRALLAGAYTFAWLCSLHDSYQHHYLLSWLLCWAVALPAQSARECLERERVSGWGLPMTSVTCAIVYFYTGVSKSEADWRAGEALRALTRSMPPGDPHPGKFDGLRDALLHLGLDDAGVWQLLALATIALQWTVSLGYLLSSPRDAKPTRWRIAVCSLALLAALSFHLVAEVFSLFEIGLFSFYMMWVALVLLAPATWLTWPTRASAWISERLETNAQSRGARDFLRPALAAVLVFCAGFTIPLPGAVWACAGFAVLLLVRASTVARRVTPRAPAMDRLALQGALVALALWCALTRSSIPFDYYRRTAGELVRMGRLEQGLEAYKTGERYAPSGQSRANKIRELERALKQRSAK